MFIVWQRDDGYIGATAGYLPRNTVTGGSEPLPGETIRPGSGIPITFEKLGQFEQWQDACDFIKTNIQDKNQ